MRDAIKKAVKDTAKRFDIGITTYSHLKELEERWMVLDSVWTVLGFGERHAAQLLKLLPASKAQLHQDLFVLSELGLKRSGYFVEFGAASGESLSNTHLLEKSFDWQGILAEPAKYWHPALFIIWSFTPHPTWLPNTTGKSTGRLWRTILTGTLRYCRRASQNPSRIV